jgi:hypothetical protein
MIIVKHLLLINLLLGFLYSQNFEIAHPYRAIDFTSNGFTTNGSKLYISTVYDGHIYEYDFSNPQNGLIDKFRMYPEVKTYPCAGSPIYLPDSDKLYVGSTWGNKIYIFENVSDKPGSEVLPEKTWSVDNEDIAYLFRPQKFRENIYWGCYHSDKKGAAKLVKLDLSADTTSIIEFDQAIQANYTQSLAIAGYFLYAGTESGQIIKYNLRSNQADDQVIDLGVKKKVYYMASDGTNIYAMLSASNFPLYKISNPASANPEVENIKSAGYTFSRMYHYDGKVYGSNWQYDVGSNKIISGSHSIALIGGAASENGAHLFGLRKDGRKKIKKLVIERILLPSGKKEIYDPEDIASKEMGAQLQTIAASEYSGKLYMSTYWTGAMYAYSPENKFEKLVTPQASHHQADIIKSHKNYIFFGCYGGDGDGYLLRYNHISQKYTQFELDNDVKKSSGTSRLTAIAFDPESNRAFFGSGELTRNNMTRNAVLRYLPVLRSTKFIDINYDQSYLDDPVRFVSLEFFNGYLYGVSYNRDMKHYIFKLDLSDIENPRFISKRDLGNLNRFKGFRDKMLHKDDYRLICGFGNNLEVFNLNRYRAENPRIKIEFDEAVGDIVSDADYYYICFKRHIKVYEKDGFTLVTQIDPALVAADKMESISLLNDVLYGITSFGRLYQFKTDF